MSETPQSKPSEQLNFLGIGITILVIIALTFLIDLDSVRSWVEQAGIWGPVIFILLKISTIVIAPLSGSPLYPLVGLLFGFWPGILYIEIGDFLGYSIAFFISRFFGEKFVSKLLSDNEEGMLARIVKHASTPKGFLHACLTLFAMPEILAYGAGLTKISYWRFISTMMPITLIGASFFVFIGSIIQGSDNSFLIGFGLPAVGVVAMIIGGTLFTKAITKKED